MNADATPQSPSSRGAALERQVALLYETLGYRVTPNIEISGRQIDILVTREVTGAPEVALAIECKNYSSSVGVQELEPFIALVERLNREGFVNGGVLVSNSSFSSQARAIARQHPSIELLTVDDLVRRVGGLKQASRLLTSEHEELDIFSSYVPLKARYINWTQLESIGADAVQESHTVEAGTAIISQFTEDGRKIIFVLADYGSGKSTLLEALRYELLQIRLGESTPVPPLPVLVRLKEFSRTQSLLELIRIQILADYQTDMSTDSVEQWIADGQLCLLLDGFDEMVDRSGQSEMRWHFRQLLPLFASPSPTVLSSRLGYIQSHGDLEIFLADADQTLRIDLTISPPNRLADKQVRDLVDLKESLRRRNPELGFEPPLSLPSPGEVSVYFLRPFSTEDIEEYIQKQHQRLQSVDLSVSDVRDFIERVYDLRDLASRPLLLKLIVDTVMSGGLSVGDPDANYGPAGIYDAYVTMKLEIDVLKGPTQQLLSPESRLLLSEAVALTMHNLAQATVEFEEVRDELSRREEEAEQTKSLREIASLTEDELRTEFLASGFIELSADGMWRFAHKSFREFLVARYIKTHLDTAPRLLSERLEPEILYFLGGFAPSEPWVESTIRKLLERSNQDRQSVQRSNLALAALYCRPKIVNGRFRRCAATGLILRNLHTDSCSFTDSVLAGVRLDSWTIGETTIRDFEVGPGEIGRLALESVRSEGFGLAVDINRLDVIDATGTQTVATGCHVANISITGSAIDMLVSGSMGEASIEESELVLTFESQGQSVIFTSVKSTRLILKSLSVGGSASFEEMNRSTLTVSGAWRSIFVASSSVLDLREQHSAFSPDRSVQLHNCVVLLPLSSSIGDGVRAKYKADDSALLLGLPVTEVDGREEDKSPGLYVSTEWGEKSTESDFRVAGKLQLVVSPPAYRALFASDGPCPRLAKVLADSSWIHNEGEDVRAKILTALAYDVRRLRRRKERRSS